MNQNLAKAATLLGIAVFFGWQAWKYPLGTVERAGPGLFPIVVSALLLAISLAILARTPLVEKVRVNFNFINIAIIVASLTAFAVLSEFVNMTVGIISTVFISSIASSDFSLRRTVAISAVLCAIAFAMTKFLGFHLPLY